MTSLCVCPHCQSEYHAYEYPLIDSNGKQHMIRKGVCPECGITLNEIPSDYDEIAEYRMQNEASALRYALGHSIREFLNLYALSEYPFYTITDREGKVHKAFTLDEAEHIGYAYYDEGWTFHIFRNGKAIKEVTVPKDADRIVLNVSYIIDDMKMSFKFGCRDQDEADRLIKLNRERPVDGFKSNTWTWY